MTAQAGDSILLYYFAQPASPQSGDAVLLHYGDIEGYVPKVKLHRSWEGVWTKALHQRIPTRGVVAPIEEIRVRADSPWDVGNHSQSKVGSLWRGNDRADREMAPVWPRAGKRLWYEPFSVWVPSTPQDVLRLAPWVKMAGSIDIAPHVPWSLSTPADAARHTPWGLTLPNSFGQFLAPHANSARADENRHIPWVRYSRPVSPGWGVVTPPENPRPGEGAQIVIPVRRVYFVINNASVVRVGSGDVLSARALQMDIDYSTWAWGFSFTLPLSERHLVMPNSFAEPVELDLFIQEMPYRVLVESVSSTKSFGQASLRVSGRSQSAYLDQPYSPKRTFSNNTMLTANQLMEACLTFNGVPIGWDIGWQISDWLVPANVWSMNGSYIEALKDIAGSVGAYLLPDPSLKKLYVKPKYKHKPWEWGSVTPDVILPTAVTTTEVSEVIDYTDYNAVFVSGVHATSVIGHVKKTGTAGDLVAEGVVHPLIHEAIAARQRGEAILGETGRIIRNTITTPVFPSTGVLEPGVMVQYTDGVNPLLGVVRGVGVSADWTDNGLVLKQTLELEIHE